MKSKSVIVIAALVAIVLLVIIMPAKPEGGSNDVPPSQIIDEPQLQEDVSVGTEVIEEPASEEIVLIKNEDGPDYYIDENGTRHYVLDAIDSPNFGE